MDELMTARDLIQMVVEGASPKDALEALPMPNLDYPPVYMPRPVRKDIDKLKSASNKIRNTPELKLVRRIVTAIEKENDWGLAKKIFKRLSRPTVETFPVALAKKLAA